MTRDRSPRPYRKRKRAEQEEETRLRITEAAMELHGTLGPAKTSITDVAKRAGVSRMTVYNHFPTETDLFHACSSHWASLNPRPDPEPWREIADPSERLRRGLTELYGWYARHEDGMVGHIVRDREVVPALGEVMVDVWDQWTDRMVAALADGWPTSGGEDARALTGALSVATDFGTYRLLRGAGLDEGGAVGLMAGMVVGPLAR